jgi:hypothetical protein
MPAANYQALDSQPGNPKSSDGDSEAEARLAMSARRNPNASNMLAASRIALLRQYEALPDSAPVTKDVVTAVLGVSLASLDRMMRNGTIEFFKPSPNAVRFRKAAIEAIQSGEGPKPAGVKTVVTIEHPAIALPDRFTAAEVAMMCNTDARTIQQLVLSGKLTASGHNGAWPIFRARDLANFWNMRAATDEDDPAGLKSARATAA